MPAPRFGIVAVAASAGGLNALTQVLSALPANFPAPIVIVQHLDRRHPSRLADILGRRTELAVTQACAGDVVAAGHAYIAPPDRHLLVDPDRRLALSEAELVHFVRPSADLLFESVAAMYKGGAIAVVLSGTGRDGSLGVKAIKKMGGTLIVQDEASEFQGMPQAARDAAAPDFILPLADIAPTLRRLVEAAD